MLDDHDLLWVFLKERAGLDDELAALAPERGVPSEPLLAVLDAAAATLAALGRLVAVTERAVNETRDHLAGARRTVDAPPGPSGTTPPVSSPHATHIDLTY